MRMLRDTIHIIGSDSLNFIEELKARKLSTAKHLNTPPKMSSGVQPERNCSLQRTETGFNNPWNVEMRNFTPFSGTALRACLI